MTILPLLPRKTFASVASYAYSTSSSLASRFEGLLADSKSYIQEKWELMPSFSSFSRETDPEQAFQKKYVSTSEYVLGIDDDTLAKMRSHWENGHQSDRLHAFTTLRGRMIKEGRSPEDALKELSQIKHDIKAVAKTVNPHKYSFFSSAPPRQEFARVQLADFQLEKPDLGDNFSTSIIDNISDSVIKKAVVKDLLPKNSYANLYRVENEPSFIAVFREGLNAAQPSENTGTNSFVATLKDIEVAEASLIDTITNSPASKNPFTAPRGQYFVIKDTEGWDPGAFPSIADKAVSDRFATHEQVLTEAVPAYKIAKAVILDFNGKRREFDNPRYKRWLEARKA